MATATLLRRAVMCGVMLVAANAAAEPAVAPKPSAADREQKSTLARANDDVLRQLRPSGLKKHAQGFGALAVRGYDDVVSKMSGKPRKK